PPDQPRPGRPPALFAAARRRRAARGRRGPLGSAGRSDSAVRVVADLAHPGPAPAAAYAAPAVRRDRTSAGPERTRRPWSCGTMIGVSDVPKNPMTRAAKMARLPIGLAGRTAIGVGKRLGGRPAEIVAQEIQQRTAEQIFRVLGELKGGAMKLGQALSIFEAA